MFSHPIFLTPTFRSYEQGLLNFLETAESPEDRKIKEAMPLIGERLEVLQHSVETFMTENIAKTEAVTRQIQIGFQNQSKNVHIKFSLCPLANSLARNQTPSHKRSIYHNLCPRYYDLYPIYL
jgi:hypothetical protein